MWVNKKLVLVLMVVIIKCDLFFCVPASSPENEDPLGQLILSLSNLSKHTTALAKLISQSRNEEKTLGSARGASPNQLNDQLTSLLDLSFHTPYNNHPNRW